MNPTEEIFVDGLIMAQTGDNRFSVWCQGGNGISKLQCIVNGKLLTMPWAGSITKEEFPDGFEWNHAVLYGNTVNIKNTEHIAKIKEIVLNDRTL